MPADVQGDIMTVNKPALDCFVYIPSPYSLPSSLLQIASFPITSFFITQKVPMMSQIGNWVVVVTSLGSNCSCRILSSQVMSTCVVYGAKLFHFTERSSDFIFIMYSYFY